MLALYVVGRGSIPSRVMPKTLKIVHAISLFSIQHFGKEHGSETHSGTRWPVPTVAFNVFAQLCGLKANAMEMGAALFTTNSEGGSVEFVNFDNVRSCISVIHLPCQGGGQRQTSFNPALFEHAPPFTQGGWQLNTSASQCFPVEYGVQMHLYEPIVFSQVLENLHGDERHSLISSEQLTPA